MMHPIMVGIRFRHRHRHRRHPLRLNSGAALATVVGALIEMPLMLLRYCQRTKGWFT
jgi:ACR3 family arsenite efflux pump ArsB